MHQKQLLYIFGVQIIPVHQHRLHYAYKGVRFSCTFGHDVIDRLPSHRAQVVDQDGIELTVAKGPKHARILIDCDDFYPAFSLRPANDIYGACRIDRVQRHNRSHVRMALKRFFELLSGIAGTDIAGECLRNFDFAFEQVQVLNDLLGALNVAGNLGTKAGEEDLSFAMQDFLQALRDEPPGLRIIGKDIGETGPRFKSEPFPEKYHRNFPIQCLLQNAVHREITARFSNYAHRIALDSPLGKIDLTLHIIGYRRTVPIEPHRFTFRFFLQAYVQR